MPRIFHAAAPLLFLTAFPVVASSSGQSVAASTVGTPEFSPRQIHAYASALLEIQKMRQVVSARAAKLEPGKAALLKSEAKAEMIRIVQKHGLELKNFNAISAKVEQQRKLRHQVKQLMMEQLLST
ncbi:hypothetical protein TomTYG75_27660 [Sphingobium sp. TomTYG75]